MGTSEVSGNRHRAGQYAQSRADELNTRLLTFVAAALAVLAFAFFALHTRGTTLAVLGVAVLIAIVAADRLLEPAIGRWSRGAEGERKVGQVLEDLGPEWRVLHNVSLGRGDIDHVLVGPAGVFTIETKSHRGRIAVDRIDPHMLAQAYAEKKLLEKISGLEVEAMLVFSRAWLIGSLPAHRRGVTVLPARMLTVNLQRRRPTFDGAEVAETGERLRLALEVDAN